jgi:hypothetical protein
MNTAMTASPSMMLDSNIRDKLSRGHGRGREQDGLCDRRARALALGSSNLAEVAQAKASEPRVRNRFVAAKGVDRAAGPQHRPNSRT